MSTTIRHVATAVGLIIKGGIESGDYGPDTTPEEYRAQIFRAVLREVKDWLEDDDALAREFATEFADFTGGYVTWPEFELDAVEDTE